MASVKPPLNLKDPPPLPVIWVLATDTGFDTLTVISDVPRLISALPFKDSEPILKSLSLENVSALPAVILPADHATSDAH